jgi:hypothetical protein
VGIYRTKPAGRLACPRSRFHESDFIATLLGRFGGRRGRFPSMGSAAFV